MVMVFVWGQRVVVGGAAAAVLRMRGVVPEVLLLLLRIVSELPIGNDVNRLLQLLRFSLQEFLQNNRNFTRRK